MPPSPQALKQHIPQNSCFPEGTGLPMTKEAEAPGFAKNTFCSPRPHSLFQLLIISPILNQTVLFGARTGGPGSLLFLRTIAAADGAATAPAG